MSEEEVRNKANSLPVICVGTSEARCAFSNSRIVLNWHFFCVISVCSAGLSSFLSRSSVLRAGGSWRERGPPACGCAGGRLRAAPWWVRPVLQLSGRERLGWKGPLVPEPEFSFLSLCRVQVLVSLLLCV